MCSGPAVRHYAGALSIMTLAALVGCRSTVTPAGLAAAHPAGRPIVLVTIDTLRADRLGAYGSSAGLTPALDAFAETAARFTAAVSQVPLTLPSHATILTGLHPARHGVRTNDGFRLETGVPTLAEALRARGYRTGAFIGGYPLNSASGLARGFDEYDDRFLNTPGVVERRADAVVQAAAAWIERTGGQPFFAWIHLFDPHSPYVPPPEYAAAHRDQPYDGEVAYTDAAVGRLFDRLERLQIFSAATIIVVADHGESLGEHGERTHGTFVYDATAHVPLLVKLPDATDRRTIDAPVETADLAPTIARVAGAALGSTDGRDLVPLVDGAHGDADRPAYVESYYLNVLLGWSPLRAVRTARWKYIEAPKPELYDLESDPHELHNIVEGRAALAGGLERALPTETTSAAPAASSPTGSERAERLHSLGYVTGSTAPTANTRAIDPKDRVAVWSEIEQGIDASAADPTGAAAAFQRALRLDPNNGLAEKYLGDLAFRAGRLHEAREGYQRAIAAGFRHPDAYVNLSSIAERERHMDEARSMLAEAVRLAPTDADAWNRIGLAEARAGRLAEAMRAFTSAIAAAPAHAEPHYNLAILERRAGNEPAAEAQLQEALARNPQYVEARYELATGYLTAGQSQRALDAYRAALAIKPDYPEALFGAARAELDLGQRDNARRDYEHFVRVAPRGYAPQVAAARHVLQQLSR